MITIMGASIKPLVSGCISTCIGGNKPLSDELLGRLHQILVLISNYIGQIRENSMDLVIEILPSVF